MQEAFGFGESSKKQALTQNLLALVLSYVDASAFLRVPDGVRSFQVSRVCISLALLPKLVMLPCRDASLSEDDADCGAFSIFWSLFRCSRRDPCITLIAGVFVCVSLSLIAVTSGLAARRIEA